MYIDSHQHFWKYNPDRDSWIVDDMKCIRRDFMPSDLKPVLENNGMDGCVAIQADQSEEETIFLLKLAAQNYFIKGVVGWVDMQKHNVEERLLNFSKYKKFKGVRHILQAEPDGFMLKEEFQRGIKALSKLGLTYDLLIKPHQLNEAIMLTTNFPYQKFVLDHIAKPAISNGIDENWENQIKELSKNKNVFCKVSGLVTETDGFKPEPDNFKVFLEVVTSAFGTERLLFGSDWPVCLVAASYNEVLKIITNYYDKQQLKMILGGNAIRFYKI